MRTKRIVHHEGCTYLRRAAHEEVGLFGWDETGEAIGDAFARVDKLTVGLTEIGTLNAIDFGQPYLMQLLGFYLVGELYQDAGHTIEVTSAQV